MDELWFSLRDLLGLDLEAHDLDALQIGLRAFIVYLVVLAVVRLGHKRFLGRSTAFDAILAILLGSVASRAITGNAPFFPTLVACGVLVAVHAVFAMLAFRSHRFGVVVKGKRTALIRAGQLMRDEMRIY
jgi:uncharacterized membrane protein YcaP (DUF421 family)